MRPNRDALVDNSRRTTCLAFDPVLRLSIARDFSAREKICRHLGRHEPLL